MAPGRRVKLRRGRERGRAETLEPADQTRRTGRDQTDHHSGPDQVRPGMPLVQSASREGRTERRVLAGGRACRTGQDRTGQDRTGQDRTGQDRTGQDRTGQDRTGQSGQDRADVTGVSPGCVLSNTSKLHNYTYML